MTTPVEDFGVFGVVLTSDGTSYMRPQNTTRPLVNGTAVRLEQGVYRVAASFDGPNEVNIRLYSPKLGNPKYWNLREVIGTIPAGGGGRGRCGWPPSAQPKAITSRCKPRAISSRVLSVPSRFSAHQTNHPAGGELGARDAGNRIQSHLRIRRIRGIPGCKRKNLACTPTGCLPAGVPGAGAGCRGGVDNDRFWKLSECGNSPREDENHTDNLTREYKTPGDIDTPPERGRIKGYHLFDLGDPAPRKTITQRGGGRK